MTTNQQAKPVNRPLNSRQRHVVLNVFSGMSQTDAYEAVYGPNTNSRFLASQLLTLPHIRAELDRLHKRQEQLTLCEMQESIMSPLEVKQRLTKLARANLVDFQDESGQPLLSKDTPNHEAATEYYHRTRIDHKGNPVITKSIKLVNPMEPLRELVRIHGMLAPSKHLVGHRVQFEIELVDKKKPELPEGEE